MHLKKVKLISCSAILVLITLFLSIGICNPFGFFAYNRLIKFHRIVSILNKVYYEKYDESELFEGAIAGYVDSLGDPYTTYMDPNLAKTFNEQIKGSFCGIGILFIPSSGIGIPVLDTIEGSPAQRAGIVSGDKVLKVNDVLLCASEYDKAVAVLRGEVGTEVSIDVEKKDSSIVSLTLTREKIQLKSVTSQILEDNVGYIKISSFTQDDDNLLHSTSVEFQEAYNSLMDKNISGLILDLRSNPGGVLRESVLVAENMLDRDSTVVYTVNKKGKKQMYKSRGNKNLVENKIAVLTNHQTASASEILAGALKDNDKALLIGEKTFGKGRVQTIFPLMDKSELKVTISRYYTPNGVCIDKEGIIPDIEVVPDGTATYDVQLQEAIDYILKV